MFKNIADEIEVISKDDFLKFKFHSYETNWMSKDDPFIERISRDNLNKAYLNKHIIKEIEIKNTLDTAVDLFKNMEYDKSIKLLDDVLFYDSEYSDALLYKSYCLNKQKHFIKALRYFKKAQYDDKNYLEKLRKNAENEKKSFPPFKLNIYNGDEHFSNGEYQKALDCYNNALKSPKLPQKILNKLLNKKATALLKLNQYSNAYDCFKKSHGDYSSYGRGLCEYKLNLDINEDFKKALKINKNLMLKQAEILIESGDASKALLILDEIFQNHFKVDDFYFKLLQSKKSALLKLSDELDKIINTLFK